MKTLTYIVKFETMALLELEIKPYSLLHWQASDRLTTDTVRQIIGYLSVQQRTSPPVDTCPTKYLIII